MKDLKEWKKYLSSLKEEKIKGLSKFTHHGWQRSIEREDRIGGKENILYCFSNARELLLRVKPSYKDRFELYFKPFKKYEVLVVVAEVKKDSLYIVSLMDNDPKFQKKIDRGQRIYKKRTGKIE
jgi:hypothetical protein